MSLVPINSTRWDDGLNNGWLNLADRVGGTTEWNYDTSISSCTIFILSIASMTKVNTELSLLVSAHALVRVVDLRPCAPRSLACLGDLKL